MSRSYNKRGCKRNVERLEKPQPNNSTIIIDTESNKRNLETAEDVSSGHETWNSLSKQRKKRKYTNAYLIDYYGETDFGNDDKDWKLNQFNVSKALKLFRQKSIEGAQQRKHLSSSRVLSLSYIFLLSSYDKCILKKQLPKDQLAIMKDLNSKEYLKPIDFEAINACYQIHTILDNEDLNKEEMEEAINNSSYQAKAKMLKLLAK